ncbi:MAG: V-type ATP synthase subunit D [Eubacteriales bacterium]
MASQVFPTKNNLINTQKSLALARLGYDLMDRKRSILVREMMMMIDKANIIQAEISATYAEAYAALQRAHITLGVCRESAMTIPVDDGLEMDFRSVMGVELPTVTLKPRPTEIYYGLDLTNSQLDDAYIKFNEVKRLTATLAEVESCVYRLADAIKKTKKRTNALDNVIIPRFKSTVKFITDALEEKDREDFSRLKVIKRNKEGK